METQRLKFRSFELSDANILQKLAGHELIAATTAGIPHPYPDGAAETWINLRKDWLKEDKAHTFAITLKSNGNLIGCVDIFGISKAHSKGEIGYWIAVDHWNQGYATEAVKWIINYGFKEMKLNRLAARYMAHNKSSGRVMEKAGMKYEGCLRQEVCKNNQFIDLVCYGVLQSELT
jgi:ribosomal-protein-alanine N-acetyltransferase